MNVTIEDIVTAAAEGDAQKIKYLLLMSKAINLNAVNTDGYTALTLGAAKGRAKALEVLLKHGADPNTRDDQQWTPLHHAVINGKIAAVTMLLRHGADLNCRFDDEGLPLEQAVLRGDDKVIAALIEGGADTNAIGRNAYTILHRAVSSPYAGTSLVYVLISRGADVDAQNDFGATALHDASNSGNIGAVVALLMNGADTSIADNRGATALAKAVRGKQTEAVEILLKYGADPNASEGRAAKVRLVFDVALVANEVEPIKTLLIHGADAASGGYPGAPSQSQVRRECRADLLQILSQVLAVKASLETQKMEPLSEQPAYSQAGAKSSTELLDRLNKMTDWFKSEGA